MLILCGPSDGAIGGTPFTAPNGETLRFGASPFVYQIPVPLGPQLLTVKAHEQFVTKPGERVFHMEVDGVVKMSNMDIIKAAQGTLVWQDIIWGGRTIELRFTTKTRSALVSSIDISPMLYWEVFRNGLRQSEGVDYTIEGGVIKPLWTGDSSEISFQHRYLRLPF